RLGGLDLLREVKRRWPGTLVVLITGYATLESAIDALRAGASDYLLKPFDKEAVEALIRRLEEGAPAVQEGPPNGELQPIGATASTLLGSLDSRASSVLGRRTVQLIAHDPAMLRILHTVEGIAISQ